MISSTPEYGALGVLTEDGRALDQFVTVGLSDEEEQAIGARPTGRGVLGTLIADDKPLRLANTADSPDSIGTPAHHPTMTSFLGVPIRVHGEVYGNLYLTNKKTAAEFSEDDEELVIALSMAAGIAIENARLHGLVRDRALTEDRDRIARDLHDSVIQRLFAIGLSLQGTARLVERPEAVMRIGEAIDKIDETIRQLRKAIFDIELTINKEGLHPKVLDLVHELRPVLGIHPQVSFSGPVDVVVTGPLAEEVLAVLREALTNVGKHARASQVVIMVAAGEELRLVVADDGQGMSGPAVGGTRPQEHAPARRAPRGRRRARHLPGGRHAPHVARAARRGRSRLRGGRHRFVRARSGRISGGDRVAVAPRATGLPVPPGIHHDGRGLRPAPPRALSGRAGRAPKRRSVGPTTGSANSRS